MNKPEYFELQGIATNPNHPLRGAGIKYYKISTNDIRLWSNLSKTELLIIIAQLRNCKIITRSVTRFCNSRIIAIEQHLDENNMLK